jgi:signal transduction histidine kinase/DNA-binding response OmpR family regulator
MSRKLITILLIEDSVADQRLIREALNDMEVNWSTSSRIDLICVDRLSAGLARLSEGGIDVVLLDLTLPDSDGIDTLVKVCAQDAAVPVVVLTIRDDESWDTQAMQLGAQDYLIKGRLDGSLLARSLRYSIERKKAEQERTQLVKEQAARSEAERSAESLRRIQAITDATLAYLSHEKLLQELLNRIAQMLAVNHAAILLLDEEEKNLTLWSLNGLDKELEKGDCMPVGAGFAGRVVAGGQPVIIKDLSEEQARGSNYDGLVTGFLRERGIRSLLGLPLLVEGRVLGVLQVGTRELREFTEDEIRLLQLVADRIGFPLDHRRMYEAERKARTAAENASKAKDEFLAIVSHELRTPLNSMLGWAQLLYDREVDNDTARRGLETIVRNAKAQTQLIEDILDVSRVISGKLRLNVRLVNLIAIIETAIESVRPAINAKGIRLQAILDPNAGLVQGDADRLQQIVWNLLSNAVKFTPKDGKVQVVLKRVNSHVEIEVSDSGSGISAEFLPYVFERFRQADASKTRRYGGLGLGLAIVRYLAEMHGGQVVAHSDGEGQGSSFRIYLPLAAILPKPGPVDQSHPTANERAPTEVEVFLRGIRILIVDDQPDTCELLRVAFSQYGAEPLTVESATAALKAIERWLPDIIVSDIGMPDMDGYELIRQVRRLAPERGGRVPAVALTAYSKKEDRMQALGAGFDLHMAKPVDPTELSVALTSLLRRHGKMESLS